jgi:hypothetical protein
VALTPTSSRGGGTFNGGTITDPLTVEPPSSVGNNPSLIVESSSTKDDGNDTFDVADSTGLNVYTVYADGSSLQRLQFNGSGMVVSGGVVSGILNVQGDNKVGFFGTVPAAKPAVTGALSTVIDPAAKAVLTSLLAALVALGLASDGTT